MRVFISSVIRDFGTYRDAAADAARTLRHDVLRAEDFGAKIDTPQVACLDGVRRSDILILVLGARYGDVQKGGLSATHEEYREARDRKRILAFIQAGVQSEPRQAEFIREVQDWGSGSCTESFSSDSELRRAVTRALHDLEVALASGPVSEADLVARADALLPRDEHGTSSISVAVSGGPRQTILSPTAMADAGVQRELRAACLTGEHATLDPDYGTRIEAAGHTLIFSQREVPSRIVVHEDGSVGITQPAIMLDRDVHTPMFAIIEEDVRTRIERALRLTSTILERLDQTRRICEVGVRVCLIGADACPWRTRREHEASPNSMTMHMCAHRIVVSRKPAARARAALSLDAEQWATDLTVLLRCQATRG